MSDIFLSYAKEDRDWARLLAKALADTGWSVFWDRTIPPGLTWRNYIGKALLEARCIVVAWSKDSVESEWVLEEAEVGKGKGILIPVLREEVQPPLGFGAIQALDLTGWSGDLSAPVFRELVKGMHRLLGPPPIEAARLKAREDERKRDEAEARRKAEEEQRQIETGRHAEVEARRRAEEEEKRRQAQAEAERRAEGARQQASAEPVSPEPVVTPPPGDERRPFSLPGKPVHWAAGAAVVLGLILYMVFDARGRGPEPVGGEVIKAVVEGSAPTGTAGPAVGDSVASRSPEPEYQAGQVFRDCPECPEMVVIGAGSFMMGSPGGEEARDEDEGPLHTVTIQRAFALGRHEITKSQFETFVEASGHDPTRCAVWTGKEWEWDDSRSWRDPGFSQTEADPVVCVSWEDAKKYVAWLSGKARKAYRLPSESEWEYAARAGTTTARYWDNEPETACEYANVGDQLLKQRYADWRFVIHDCADGHVNTAPVGSLAANQYKLHDVLGNVWEWAEDCWNEGYSGAPADGSAWVTGDCERRVVRGGSWGSGPGGVRSASRGRNTTTSRNYYRGFRVARTLP